MTTEVGNGGLVTEIEQLAEEHAACLARLTEIEAELAAIKAAAASMKVPSRRKPMSAETRLKMSEAKKRAWDEKRAAIYNDVRTTT